ncbi:hypothetical protein R2B70_08940 [Aeromonas sp. XH]|uniref:hypothetical protein n=1 Tax=Aeromonas sp. XH TaxID=3081770 RepID=UPI002966E93C|nr:hypothetical protein [Aeromonas sp. XH]WOX50082.1 hypothetical protein R2B70_08940 [Aeromonas sp. XH]
MKKKKEINWERWHWLRQHLKQIRRAPDPIEPQAKITTFLTNVFAAIPVITAGIYLSGMAYHLGECLVDGLEIFEFPWPADLYLAWGYMQWLDAGKIYLKPVFWGIVAIAFIIVVLFVCVGLRLRWAWYCHRLCSIRLPKVKKFLRRRALVPTPRLFIFFFWLKIIYDRFAILIIPALLVLLPAFFSFNEGISSAQARVDRLENDQLTAEDAKTQSVLLKDTPHIRLICNGVHCAYRLKGGQVTLVRHEQTEKVTWIAPKDIPTNSSKVSRSE